MEVSRQQFIKLGVGGLLGALILKNISVPLSAMSEANSAQAPSQKKAPGVHAYNWGFVVDIRKCIGCGSCLRACKKENDVPLEPEYNRTWVERYTLDENENVFVDSPNAGYDGFKTDYVNAKYQNISIKKSFFVPKLCNHCEKPPCVTVCPVSATYKSKEGQVLVNRKACIGCRYCVQACPFGARFFDPRLKIVDKCTLCYHRTTRGLLPVCVETCPTGARMYGDLTDPASPISQVIKNETIGVLKEDLGCENKIYYIGLEKGVR